MNYDELKAKFRPYLLWVGPIGIVIIGFILLGYFRSTFNEKPHRINHQEYYQSTYGYTSEPTPASALPTFAQTNQPLNKHDILQLTLMANDVCIRPGETLSLTFSLTNIGLQRIDTTFDEFDLDTQTLYGPRLKDVQGGLQLPKKLELNPNETITYTINPVPSEVYSSNGSALVYLKIRIQNEDERVGQGEVPFFSIYTYGCTTEPLEPFKDSN